MFGVRVSVFGKTREGEIVPGRSYNSRAVAARIVARWLKSADFPDRLLEDISTDRAFVMEMVYGIVRRRRTLDWVIARCADRRPAKEAVPYLLVGLYQLLVMDNVAPHAAVSETVNAVTPRAKYAAKFINAVLRRVLREKDNIRGALARQPLAVRESHPDLLVERWTDSFNPARTASLCEWNNGRPNAVICVNGLRTDTARLAHMLSDAGIDARPHPAAPGTCLALPRGTCVTDVPGFAEGLFTVQDPSTLEAVRLLDPRPGERVLDACAAPGGKTAIIAQRMQVHGTIVSMDVHADRLRRLRENVERLGLTNVRIVQGDATGTGIAEAANGKAFDRVLLDVPCTNTGVLSRRPDARWRFSLERLADLARTQRAMLDNAAAHVAPGGTIVYSTCSLEPEEGKLLVSSWLAEQSDFESVATVSHFPPETDTDGIFAASLRRR